MRFGVWGVLVLISCASDGTISDQFTSKLRRCDLLGPGESNAYQEDFPTAEDECFGRCLVGGTCGEIDAYLCRSDLILETRCAARCFEQPEQYTCADGSMIDLDRQCDGIAQCPDGEDEEGCDVFTCSDSREIPVRRVCDFRWDCINGEDERGCPGFRCADGTSIQSERQCDGREDCVSGSDELGCAMFTCDDGETIIEAWRCDFIRSCFDGSDEVGCAESRLSCD